MKLFSATVSGQRRLVGLLLLFLIFGTISKPARADQTFYYTGPEFSASICQAEYPQTASACLSGGHITASFTFPDSVVASGYAASTDVISWTISGPPVGSLSGNSSDADALFHFSNGQITAWLMSAFTIGPPFPSGVPGIISSGLESVGNLSFGDFDAAFLSDATNPTDPITSLGFVLTPPNGTWTGTYIPPPTTMAKAMAISTKKCRITPPPVRTPLALHATTTVLRVLILMRQNLVRAGGITMIDILPSLPDL